MSKYMDNPQNINENNINNSAPIDDTTYQRPTSLLGALSIIQRFYIIESKSTEDLPKDYFTLQQIWDFFKTGFKSGFIESLLFFTMLPFLQTIYPSFKLYFFNAPLTEEEKFILNLISFSPLVISTIFLIFLTKYYKGAVTKRALGSLFLGRSVAFAIKGSIVYILLMWLAHKSYSDPNFIYSWISAFGWLIELFVPYKINQEFLYMYFYKFIIPALTITAKEILYSMVFFALLPFFTLFLKGIINRKKQIDNLKAYEEY